MVAEKSSEPILEFRSVTKQFDIPRQSEPLVVLKDLSFSVQNEQAGEFVALLGPSGSGKSTILNMMSGLLQPDSGEIRVLGEPVSVTNHKSVTVPQAYTCYPWRTVRGNVEFGLEVQGMAAAERRRVATEYLERVGLADRSLAYPRELSGGMQQRVAIARALAMRPPVVLMDEPFGALDAQTRTEMQQMLLELWTAEKSLIFFITHDIGEALLLADRVLVLGSRPGRIVHDLRVPFARPRAPELATNPLFAQLVQQIMGVLRGSATVQVRA